MFSEDRLERWITSKLRESANLLPVTRVSLRELAKMSDPKVPTQGGGFHRFHASDLKAAADLLPEHARDWRVFPLTFNRMEELGTGVYAIQGGDRAAEVFERLMGRKLVNRTEDGTWYTYKSIILEFLSRYPSLGIITL